MTEVQKHALLLRDTDISGATQRFCDNEQLYISCLRLFLDDPTVAQLNQAISRQHWDDAFTAAHALKGLAGNMGFVPLMHATGQLVIAIRGGRTGDISRYMAQVNSSYRDISDAIRKNFL